MKEWLKAAGIRALKTVAQAAIATIGTGAVLSDIDWKLVISASIVAGILSLLTSTAGLPELKLQQKTTTDETGETVDELSNGKGDE